MAKHNIYVGSALRGELPGGQATMAGSNSPSMAKAHSEADQHVARSVRILHPYPACATVNADAIPRCRWVSRQLKDQPPVRRFGPIKTKVKNRAHRARRPSEGFCVATTKLPPQPDVQSQHSKGTQEKRSAAKHHAARGYQTSARRMQCTC